MLYVYINTDVGDGKAQPKELKIPENQLARCYPNVHCNFVCLNLVRLLRARGVELLFELVVPIEGVIFRSEANFQERVPST